MNGFEKWDEFFNIVKKEFGTKKLLVGNQRMDMETRDCRPGQSLK